MTADAGLQAILDRFNPPADGVGIEVDASLAVQVGRLATALELDRKRRERFDQAMAQAVRGVPLRPVQKQSGSNIVFSSSEWVCLTGYVWYPQLIVAKNLGSTDTVWVYRTGGKAPDSIALLDDSARWPLTQTSPAWGPGRTGFRVGPGDGIAVYGTISNQVTVSIDTVILEDWIEPDYLL